MHNEQDYFSQCAKGRRTYILPKCGILSVVVNVINANGLVLIFNFAVVSYMLIMLIL